MQETTEQQTLCYRQDTSGNDLNGKKKANGLPMHPMKVELDDLSLKWLNMCVFVYHRRKGLKRLQQADLAIIYNTTKTHSKFSTIETCQWYPKRSVHQSLVSHLAMNIVKCKNELPHRNESKKAIWNQYQLLHTDFQIVTE